jgi:hypothetical protein
MPAQVRTKYQGDDNTIYAMRLSPTFAEKAGTVPTGAVTSPIKAKVTKSTKEFGLRPRGVTLARTVGTAPDTFVKTTFLPCLTLSVFNGNTFALAAKITIDGVEWEVVSRRPEDYN